MIQSSERNDEATAEDKTPHGAPKPEDFDGREREGEEREIPPEVRDKQEDRYQDKSGVARENANPDQHRDEEEYD
ncbi:hypothetical protein [Halobellus ruber]|uniref:Uncharacterized protein n=1 Tax=Halobellus ruber TaxID=2761102 RepID=A0A7J9SMU2_9EURY|nr:hypothetical protein [Halobellus ruber]MBB6647469.1 hypothetical protein [Halobellus ruber]